jgi:hypothetical protein
MRPTFFVGTSQSYDTDHNAAGFSVININMAGIEQFSCWTGVGLDVST